MRDIYGVFHAKAKRFGMIVLVRLFGSCLLIAALGSCTEASASTVKGAIILLVGGIACVCVREGVPGLRLAFAGALIPLSLAIVGNGELGDRAAVAVIVVAVMALRTEPFRCDQCGGEELRNGRFCARCGAAR